MDAAFVTFRDMCRKKLMMVEEIITEVGEGVLAGSPSFAMIDGGAHHGYHALRFAKLENCAKVVAVEADPYTIVTLRDRIGRAPAAVSAKIEIQEVALQDDDRRTEVVWMSSPSHPGRSGISSIWQNDPAVEFRESVSVKTTTIDQIRDRFRTPVRFIKLDLEGGDYIALKGAYETLVVDRPTVVFENSNRAPGIYGYTIPDVIRYFDKIDYKLVSFEGEIVGEKNFYDFWELWASPVETAEALCERIRGAWQRKLAEAS